METIEQTPDTTSSGSSADTGYYREGGISFKGSRKHTAKYAFREQYFRWLLVTGLVIGMMLPSASWWPGLPILIVVYRLKSRLI